jgi:hypothetical protein
MAIVANTFLTFDAKGLREDLTDVIYNISPEDTPFVSNAAKGTCKQTLHEWQQDSLAAAAANAQLEGDDVASFTAVVASVRVGNYTQISRKTLILSGTEEVVDKAGRKSELAYQLAKRGAELKRDIEFTCLSNVAGVAGNSTTARTAATMGAFIKTNTDFGAGGVDPTWTAGVPTPARTDGTQRSITEALFKVVAKEVWVSGGNPRMVLAGPFNKSEISGFAGVATKTFYQSAVKATAIIGAADIYVSDFGTYSIVPSRFGRDRDCWFIDPDYVSINYLRPMQTMQLAKTGDADKRMLLTEWTLKVGNEAAHGGLFDLDLS